MTWPAFGILDSRAIRDPFWALFAATRLVRQGRMVAGGIPDLDGNPIVLRIGPRAGPVTAGVIGEAPPSPSTSRATP